MVILHGLLIALVYLAGAGTGVYLLKREGKRDGC